MGKGIDFYNLGRVFEIHGDLRKALNQYEESLKIFSQLNQQQYVNVIKQNIDSLQKKIG
jgi:NAD-dependent SIR2 family protein deacetylase